jgi:hypothetical protein
MSNTANTAKEKIVATLRDDTKGWAERTATVRTILDEFKGSYAARYFLEALMMMGGDNPTNLVLLRTGCELRGTCQLFDAIQLLTPPEVNKDDDNT